MVHPKRNAECGVTIVVSHRERDDNYHRVIRKREIWRIITCKDDWQWIIQHRTRAGSPDGARWEAVSYCRDRNALVRLWTRLTGESGATLESTLPTHFLQRPG